MSAGGAPPGRRVVSVSRVYVNTLVVVVILTFVCLLAWIVMSWAIAHPSSTQVQTINGLQKAFFGFVGTLVGTLGGKADDIVGAVEAPQPQPGESPAPAP